MPTLSCPVAPPCTQVLLTECRRRSPLLLPPPSRSRSLLLLRGSTPSGSVAPSWPPCPPSSRCGSASRSMMRQAPPSSTASASKRQRSLPQLPARPQDQTATTAHRLVALMGLYLYLYTTVTL